MDMNQHEWDRLARCVDQDELEPRFGGRSRMTSRSGRRRSLFVSIRGWKEMHHVETD
jgi:hypothetical protein